MVTFWLSALPRALKKPDTAFDLYHSIWLIDVSIKENKSDWITCLSKKELSFILNWEIQNEDVYKNVIKKNQLFADLKTKEDFVFWLRLTKRNYDFYPIRKPLTSWRDVKSSLSSSIIQKLFDAYSVYRFYLRENVLKAIFSTIILSLNFLRKW